MGTRQFSIGGIILEETEANNGQIEEVLLILKQNRQFQDYVIKELGKIKQLCSQKNKVVRDADCIVRDIIQKSHEISRKEIREETNISDSELSRITTVLENKGLITRFNANSDDRREISFRWIGGDDSYGADKEIHPEATAESLG